MKKFESALSLIDSYRHFLSNDKTLSKTVKQRLKNFINLVNYLIQLKITPNKISSYYLNKYFNSDLLFREWFNEKITDLNIRIKEAV
ncbi:MAG: hypothetical protein HGGPFJEG_00397 [Ignavibacteria bacterium]|nr:hypothetical protein [Ignavibacteria bacterium]